MSQVDTSIYNNVAQLKLPDYQGIAARSQAYRANEQVEQENKLTLDAKAREQGFQKATNDAIMKHSVLDESGAPAVDEQGVPKVNLKGVLSDLTAQGFGAEGTKLVQSFQEKAAQLQKTVAGEQDLKRKTQQGEHDKLMVGLSRVPPAEQAAAYARWVGAAKQKGAIPADTPDDFDPGYVAMHVQKQISPEKAAELASRAQPAQKPVPLQQVTGRSDVAFNPATGTYVPTGDPAATAETRDPTRISGMTVDARGNRKVEPQVVRQFKETQDAVNTGDTVIKMLPDIKAAIPVASSTKVGGVVSEALGAGLGLDVTLPGQGGNSTRKIADANKRLEGFATFALGVLDSPLMKGAPSEGDARRALGIINNPTASPEEKLRAVEQFEGSVKSAQVRHNEALSQFDDETLKYLKGLGVKPASIQESPTAPKALSTRKIPVTKDVIRKYVEANKAAGYNVTEEQAKDALLKSGKFSQ